MSLSDLPPLDIASFPVDASHIMMFARAVGDPNPVYWSEEGASKSPVGGIIAPPTFLEAALHFHQKFPFRPRVGERWWGSATEPVNGPNPIGEGGGTSFHAATYFDYHRLLRAGARLSAATRPGKTWEKDGRRSGRLSFHESVTEFREVGSRELVVTSTTVGVTTGRKVDQTAASGATVAKRTAPWRRPDFPARYPVGPLRASVLKAGDSFSELLIDDLPRAQIHLYAGASGDFSPQHTDEVYNTKIAGYKSVFAHGMLTMGMTGRMLTDWVGDGRLTRFGMNFYLQVWPGDSLTGRARAKAIREEHGSPLVDLEVETVNQYGEVVISGYASARIDR